MAVAFVLAAAAGCGGPGGNTTPLMCQGGSQSDTVFVRMMFVKQAMPGVSAGFDVDGRITETGVNETCGKPSLVAPDGTKGIDNQMSVLVPALEAYVGNTLDGLIQDAINNGMLLFGMSMKNLDGRTADDCVSLELRLLTGTPQVGTDRLLDANQTFDTAMGAPVSRANGRVEGGSLVAGPFELTVPVRILDAQFNLEVHEARLRLALDASGASSGLLGGTVKVKDVVENLSRYAIGENLKKALPSLLDSIADQDYDGMGVCRQFSLAMELSGKKAFINP